MHCSYQNDNRMYSILRIKTIFTIFNELTRSGQLGVFSPVIVTILLRLFQCLSSLTSTTGLLQRDHPGIAISVKTRNAVRTILNHTRETIHQLYAGMVFLSSYRASSAELVFLLAIAKHRSPEASRLM